MAGVTYDTGALIAAERNDRRMWALHAGLLAEKIAPVVPAPVLAEAWRGGPRQANVARLLTMCDVEWMTEDQARTVGVLAGQSGHDDDPSGRSWATGVVGSGTGTGRAW
jgi:hypothetical protein